MCKQYLRSIAAVLVGIMCLSTSAGCTKKEGNKQPSTVQQQSTEKQTEQQQTVPEEIRYSFEGVQDSSDLPDWKGKILKLKVWQAAGANDERLHKKAAQDVVAAEIKRVCGIEIDYEKSFDNGSQDYEVKRSTLAASNDWPDILVGKDLAGADDPLIANENIWELSTWIPQYAPDLLKLYPKEKLNWWTNYGGNVNEKIYQINTMVSSSFIGELNPDLNAEKISRISTDKGSAGEYGWIWVRDDILKKLYPNAKTVQEIKDLYVKNGGKFNKEDLLDFTINSREELADLLRRIKTLGVREGKKTVEPFFTHCDIDNWPILTILNGALSGYTGLNNYFTYWDKKSGKIEYMFKQEFLKEDVRFYNRLHREGLISKAAFTDPNTTFYEKLNNGLYATSYAWLEPDKAVLEKAGKPYAYRKVMITVPVAQEQFVVFKGKPTPLYPVVLFKTIKEEDLPQVLRWIDYMVSDAGTSMAMWGPRNAGLREEKDGKRVFKDKELEECLVYGKSNQKDLHYGLNGKTFPGYPLYAENGGKWNPKYDYSTAVNPENALLDFKPAAFEQAKMIPGIAPNIWEFLGKVPEVDRFWKSRSKFEEMLKQCFMAKSDDEFDTLWSKMVKFAETEGLNSKTLNEINKVFAEGINKEDMGALK